jgi:phage baseplate assembly protein gpV
LNHKKDGLTFFEVAPDGSKVTKVKGKNYEIYLSDNNIHVKGVCNITVDGDANVYVKGNSTEKVDGNANITVGGNVTETVAGNMTLNIAGSFTGKASSWTFTGDITENGSIQVNGGVTATGDVIGAGISLDGHTHGLVKSGGDSSGPPQ